MIADVVVKVRIPGLCLSELEDKFCRNYMFRKCSEEIQCRPEKSCVGKRNTYEICPMFSVPWRKYTVSFGSKIREIKSNGIFKTM